MLYSNVEFIVFFAAVYGLFFIADDGPKIKVFVLAISNILFYIWAGFGDFLIFLFVVFISWVVVWFAEQGKLSKVRDNIVIIGILLLTFNLFFWKYSSWVVQSIQSVFPMFLHGNRLNVVLPIGVSFFTLQGLAYLIDYRRGAVSYLSFGQVFLTKSFFPQLIAGPIVRMQQLAPQLNGLSRLRFEDAQIGLALFLLGFFKKVAIADRMGGVVDPVFNNPSAYTVDSILLALVAYTIQIWGDFSGYTDMGRGVARMLGVNLPENFLSPYLAKSPSEFWRRWHITLSQWIRDYIYMPMGGGRGNIVKVLFVLAVTMTISGLWHGAAITFMLWGLYHGFLMILERSFRHFAIPIFDKYYSIVIMWALIMFGWLLFRAQSLDSLLLMLRSIFDWNSMGNDRVSRFTVIFGVCACFAFHIIFYKPLVGNKLSIWELIVGSVIESRHYSMPVGAFLKATLLAFIMVFTLLLRVESASGSFIYFQF